MKLKLTLKYKPYDLAFKRPLITATGTITRRMGIILECSGSDLSSAGSNLTMLSDAAPLPGYSAETLEQVVSWLTKHHAEACRYLEEIVSCNRYFTSHTDYLNTAVQWDNYSFFQNTKPPPSVAFALDCIGYQWHKAARRDSGSGDSGSGGNSHLRVPVNMLIQSIEEIENGLTLGFRTFKCKIGSDFSSDLAKIHEIRNRYPDTDTVQLRLDVNGSWTMAQAERHLPQLTHLGIAYVEQPVSTHDLFRYGAALREFGIPIGADESVRTPVDAYQLLAQRACDVMVLKPMMIGRIRDLVAIRQQCDEAGVACVLTTSLESSIGRYCTALIADQYFNTGIAHGLATGQLLSQDLDYHPERVCKGHLEYDAL